MEEKKVPFDRKKHVCYSLLAKKVILSHLKQHCRPEEAGRLWARIQLQYADFLRQTSDMGGKANRHNGVGGTYDCIALFAYYEVLNHEPTVEEIYQMNLELLSPASRGMKLLNANRPFSRRLMQHAFEATAKKDEKHRVDWPGNYLMTVEKLSKTDGIHYRFDKCPIVHFAKKHGYLHLMPAICNTDYVLMENMHAGLIRKTTCANGACCDFWIVGDRHPALKEHPRKTDEAGYWYNE